LEASPEPGNLERKKIAIEREQRAGSASDLRSPATMISVLSLVVAAAAVFVGPFVARANMQRQIQVTAREA
jgi:hypothetical protein